MVRSRQMVAASPNPLSVRESECIVGLHTWRSSTAWRDSDLFSAYRRFENTQSWERTDALRMHIEIFSSTGGGSTRRCGCPKTRISFFRFSKDFLENSGEGWGCLSPRVTHLVNERKRYPPLGRTIQQLPGMPQESNLLAAYTLFCPFRLLAYLQLLRSSVVIRLVSFPCIRVLVSLDKPVHRLVIGRVQPKPKEWKGSHGQKRCDAYQRLLSQLLVPI